MGSVDEDGPGFRQLVQPPVVAQRGQASSAIKGNSPAIALKGVPMARDRIQEALEDLRSELACVDFAIENLEAIAEARKGEVEKKPEAAAGGKSRPSPTAKEARPKAKAAGAGA
jgi:hypothetical protein